VSTLVDVPETPRLCLDPDVDDYALDELANPAHARLDSR
jgi:hypothetical protein